MRVITVADYFIEFLIANGVTNVFGYQGGMVCHIFDSLKKYKNQIQYHCYANEQGASFAACGYASATGQLGVIITTSGPGFTNALTGLANAWFDSLPLMLISGQVNTKDKKRKSKIRQFGFQEIQSIEIAKSIVKQTFEIDDDVDIVNCLSQAYNIAMSDRKGPVFLDFPINIGRKQIKVNNYIEPCLPNEYHSINTSNYIIELLHAKKPIILAGAGIKQCGMEVEFRLLVDALKIPVVTTLPAIDLLPSNSIYNVGYLGGTARRNAGIILANTDFVLTLGTRLCNKAIGYNHEQFIPKATKLIRVDIDDLEFERNLVLNEVCVKADIRAFISNAIQFCTLQKTMPDHTSWVKTIQKIKELLEPIDITIGNQLLRAFTDIIPVNSNLVFDVGNNLIYSAQSSIIKEKTKVFMSAGLGSMGYAIPSATGICIGNHGTTYAIVGDGGAQMNIQELNYIAKNKLPIKILVLNNKALGHIVVFQEHYLNNRFVATREYDGDYYSCNFCAIAMAYGIRAYQFSHIEELNLYKTELQDNKPALFEFLFDDCNLLPNIHAGEDCLVSEPKLSSILIEEINRLLDNI